MADAIATRRFGAAEVALLSAGRIFEQHPHFPQGGAWRASAELDADGRVVHGLTTAVVRLGEAVVVIDPAFFEDAEEAAGYFDAEMAQSAEQALAAIGLMPDDVTHVVVTHGHRDHYWAVLTRRDGTEAARFGNAEHLVPAADWTLPYPGALLGRAVGSFDGMSEADFVARLHRYLAPVERAGRLTLVDRGREIRPGIELLWTGGETQGHMVVRVDGGDDRAFWYLGDLIHFTAELEDPAMGPTRLDAGQLKQLLVGRERVFAAMADEGRACGVYSHAPFPGWGTVEQAAPGAWAWRWDR